MVFDIANPLGLLGRSPPETNWYLLSNGELVPEDKAGEILKALDNELETADKRAHKSISQHVRSA